MPVLEIWRYPVKSPAGERLHAARVDARGDANTSEVGYDGAFAGQMPEPTPGLEPGTPSLRDIPNEEVGDHERPNEGAFDLQMCLFDPDGVDRP